MRDVPPGSPLVQSGSSFCALGEVKDKLRKAGLRPTRQRVLLGWMLFGRAHRHVCAEDLFEEANRARAGLSQATVYNTLRQFTDAGLLRQVHMAADRAYFDTNVHEHHHFVVEGEGRIIDVPDMSVALTEMPAPPAGFAIAGIDVIVRLRRVDDAV